MEKPRATYFTAEEQTLIMSRFEDLKHIIKAKSSTLVAAKRRQQCWQEIADSVNACNPGGCKRTWEQMRVKHKNIIQTANRKRNEQRKTGGGPPPAAFTPAEELALSTNVGRPLMVGVAGGVSTDPGGSSSHHLFIQDDGENVVLLPPPNHPLPHTEESLDDDETLSVFSESALPEEGTLPPPQPGPSTSRPSTSRPSSRQAEADSVRALYKRTLVQAIDINGQTLQINAQQIQMNALRIRKYKLEVEKLERERQEWLRK